jgi:uncharacterized protein (DUF2141 family)
MRRHRPLRPATRAALAASALLLASGALAARLEITLEEVRSAEGRVLVQVFEAGAAADDPAGNDPDAAVAALSLAPAPPRQTFTVDLPPGAYGLRVMHDLDGDGEMDTNLVGLPTEPWAFSNNATGRFGPPSQEAIRFELTDAPSAQTLRLVH